MADTTMSPIRRHTKHSNKETLDISEKKKILKEKPPLTPVKTDRCEKIDITNNAIMTPRLLNLSSNGIEDIFSQTVKLTPTKLSTIKKRERSLSKGETIGGLLYEKGLSFISEKNRKVEEFLSQTCPFKPILNKRSEKIVRQANTEGRPLYKTKKDPKPVEDDKPRQKLDLNKFIHRNYKLKVDKIKERNSITPQPKDNFEQCTFKPQINQSSKEMVKSRDLYRQAVLSQRKLKEKQEISKIEAEKAELLSCTFHPELFKALNLSPKRSTTPRMSSPKRYSCI